MSRIVDRSVRALRSYCGKRTLLLAQNKGAGMLNKSIEMFLFRSDDESRKGLISSFWSN